MLRVIALVVTLLPGLALAQSFPEYENLYVNDYANLLDETAEAELAKDLETLKQETGVEATVLTLYTRWGYESTDSLETFSTALFNHWGIGDAEKNDGILVFVVSEDREMRIELGAGYPAGYDGEAQAIIDRYFLPAFREGDFQKGIVEGTDAVITHIARAHAAGEPAPTGTSATAPACPGSPRPSPG